MTQLFISHTPEDVLCAQQLRTDLESRGYQVWRDPGYHDPRSATYPHMIENAILASAAVLLVWSSSASQTAWIERHLLFAQRTKKPIFPVLLDSTPLPNTLISVAPLTAQAPYTDVVATLVALPQFPFKIPKSHQKRASSSSPSSQKWRGSNWTFSTSLASTSLSVLPPSLPSCLP